MTEQRPAQRPVTKKRRRRRRKKTGLRRFIPSWRVVILTAFAAGVLGVGGLLLAVAASGIPQPKDIATAQTTILYYADGETEIARLGEANRRSVDLNVVPLHAQQAVLAAEDRQFYEHGGFSPIGIARAFINNLTSNSTQGASTITQQYAKNAYLTQDRTLVRKARELVLSIRLETESDKDQILENYLNTIYFGRGSYGIQTAAESYFGVQAKDLTVSQAAVLAAIIRSPGGYAPEKNLERLQERWTYTLDAMVQQGWLTQAERADQVFPEIVERNTIQRFSGPRGHVMEAVRQSLLELGFSQQDIDLGGLRVVTTFEEKAQEALVKAVDDKGPKENIDRLRIGVAAVRPGTGEVLAIYGGADYLKDQLNNATQAIGQAGSTFKPFTLAAAIEDGITLESTWNGNSGIMVENYKVNNYDQKSWGEVSLLQATEFSINSPYVALGNLIGPNRVVDAAIRAGIPAETPALEPVLSVPLGVASPHVLEVANAYATFAARGIKAQTYVVKEVVGANGGILFQARVRTDRAFDDRIADVVNFALQKVIEVGTGKSANIGRPAAGKTGTTNENKSAWFVGHTPQIAAAVMMVKDDENGNPVSLRGTGGRRSVTGGSFPAAIWSQFMREAHRGLEVQSFVAPEDLIPIETPTAVITETVTAPAPTDDQTPTAEPSTVTPTPVNSPTPTQTPSRTVSASTTATPKPSASTATPKPSGSTSAVR